MERSVKLPEAPSGDPGPWMKSERVPNLQIAAGDVGPSTKELEIQTEALEVIRCHRALCEKALELELELQKALEVEANATRATTMLWFELGKALLEVKKVTRYGQWGYLLANIMGGEERTSRALKAMQLARNLLKAPPGLHKECLSLPIAQALALSREHRDGEETLGAKVPRTTSKTRMARRMPPAAEDLHGILTTLAGHPLIIRPIAGELRVVWVVAPFTMVWEVLQPGRLGDAALEASLAGAKLEVRQGVTCVRLPPGRPPPVLTDTPDFALISVLREDTQT